MTLEQVDKKIKYWQGMKDLLNEEILEDATLDSIIYKRYLEMENVKQVASWLNDKGYRRKSTRTGDSIKYNSNDITERLNDKNAQVPEALKGCVKQLFATHKAYANKRYN